MAGEPGEAARIRGTWQPKAVVGILPARTGTDGQGEEGTLLFLHFARVRLDSFKGGEDLTRY